MPAAAAESTKAGSAAADAREVERRTRAAGAANDRARAAPAEGDPKKTRRSLRKLYSQAGLSDADMKERHKRLGYDPLDRALKNERLAHAESSSKSTGESKEDAEKRYRSRIRSLLREHIETMAEIGIVYHQKILAALNREI